MSWREQLHFLYTSVQAGRLQRQQEQDQDQHQVRQRSQLLWTPAELCLLRFYLVFLRKKLCASLCTETAPSLGSAAATVPDLTGLGDLDVLLLCGTCPHPLLRSRKTARASYKAHRAATEWLWSVAQACRLPLLVTWIHPVHVLNTWRHPGALSEKRPLSLSLHQQFQQWLSVASQGTSNTERMQSTSTSRHKLGKFIREGSLVGVLRTGLELFFPSSALHALCEFVLAMSTRRFALAGLHLTQCVSRLEGRLRAAEASFRQLQLDTLAKDTFDRRSLAAAFEQQETSTHPCAVGIVFDLIVEVLQRMVLSAWKPSYMSQAVHLFPNSSASSSSSSSSSSSYSSNLLLPHRQITFEHYSFGGLILLETMFRSRLYSVYPRLASLSRVVSVSVYGQPSSSCYLPLHTHDQCTLGLAPARRQTFFSHDVDGYGRFLGSCLQSSTDLLKPSSLSAVLSLPETASDTLCSGLTPISSHLVHATISQAYNQLSTPPSWLHVDTDACGDAEPELIRQDPGDGLALPADTSAAPHGRTWDQQQALEDELFDNHDFHVKFYEMESLLVDFADSFLWEFSQERQRFWEECAQTFRDCAVPIAEIRYFFCRRLEQFRSELTHAEKVQLLEYQLLNNSERRSETLDVNQKTSSASHHNGGGFWRQTASQSKRMQEARRQVDTTLKTSLLESVDHPEVGSCSGLESADSDLHMLDVLVGRLLAAPDALRTTVGFCSNHKHLLQNTFLRDLELMKLAKAIASSPEQASFQDIPFHPSCVALVCSANRMLRSATTPGLNPV